MKEKNIIQRFKAWRIEIIRKWAQRYANLIINQLDSAIARNSEKEFLHWMNQGMILDMNMVEKYDIYLD